MADNQCTYVDGIASTISIDTAGEIVDLAGIDCSSLTGGALNWEHKNDIPAQICGKILEYKKIFSDKDCENDRHKYYWDKCKTPFLYVMGRLFDDKKESAKECAALFIDDAEHPNEHPMVGFSIEGSKVDKQGIVVTKSIARKLTITNANANKQCVAEMIPSKPEKPDADSLFKNEPSVTIELFEKAEPMSDMKKALPPSPPKKAAGFKPLSTASPMPTKEPKATANNPGTVAYKDAGEHQGWKVSMAEHPKHGLMINFEKPKHYPVLVHQNKEEGHKDFGKYYVKQAGKIAGTEGRSGVHDTAKDAMNHAKKLVGNINSGVTASQGQVNMASDPHVAAQEKKSGLKKAMSAGSGMASPGALSGGAVLGKESLDKKIKKGFEDKKNDSNVREGSMGMGMLARAEQEYQAWSKREEFEAYMAKTMPDLTKGEVIALGQTLVLNKSLKAEKKLKEMAKKMAGDNISSFIQKKQK